MKPFQLILLTIGLMLTASCSKDKDEDIEQTEREYYDAAQASLRSGNYTSAVERLQLLEARFPFGRYGEQAQLEIIYAYYKSGEAESARSAADRFLRLHPQHPNADYALYLRGMASFEEDQNFLERFLPLDPSTRDPGAARDAFGDFAELIRRYPDSRYSPDAKQRMIYLRNLLAQYEIHVARYYIQREAYVAAANRGRYVFERFQETPSVPDALAIMVESYKLMDMEELANETLKVLSTNFPDHASLDENGQFKMKRAVRNRDRSWLNIMTFGLAG